LAPAVPRVAVKSRHRTIRRIVRRLKRKNQAMLYQSDVTQFLNQLKQQKPTLEDEQRKGRALLWDKQPIDLDERAAQQDARVKQTSYVYYQNF
jgi:hypothetical protein